MTIHERLPYDQLQPVGAGIGIQPIGLTVLHRMGLLEPILRHGARVDRLHGVAHASGRDVLDLTYSAVDERLFGVGLHRGVLYSELLQGILAREGSPSADSDHPAPGSVALRAGVSIDDMHHHGNGCVSLLDTTGTSHGPYDLVVVADGTKSHIRSKLPWRSHERPYPFGCAWTIVPDDEHVFCDSRTLSQVYDGTATMLGFLPTGHKHSGPAVERDSALSGPPTVSIFWSLPVASMPAFRDQSIDAWKDTVLRLEPRAAPLLSHVSSHDDVDLATYSDVSMRRFGQGPVVVLGDCAHAMSPQVRARDGFPQCVGAMV